MNNNDEFQLYLKSKYGTSMNGEPSFINFDLNNRPIIVGNENKIKLTVSDATIKVTWYNVNSYNNFLNIDGYHFNIDPKNYNVYTLLTELQSILSFLNIDVTYDSAASIYIFYCTTAITFFDDSTCGTLLGLDFSEGDLFGNYIISTKIIDLTYTSNIYITSPQLLNISRDTYHTNALNDVLASIQVTTNNLGLIYYKSTLSTILYTTKITNFDIILKDENNKILQMNGGYWNMTFTIKVIPNEFIQNQKNLLTSLGIN